MRENGTDDDSGENSDDNVVVKPETFEASWGTVIHYVYRDTTVRFFNGTALVSLDYGGTCFMCGPGCGTREFLVKAGGHYQMKVIDGDNVLYHESKGPLDEDASALGRLRGAWFLGGGCWPG